MRGIPTLMITAAGACALIACGSKNEAAPLTEAPAVPLVNASGEIIGQVRGGDGAKGAMLLIEAHGLPPGVHGIHVHDVGACEPPSFDSAGPHWNPLGKQHGTQNPLGPHMGDLQNVTVGTDGRLRAQILVPGSYLRAAGRKAGSYQILDQNGASIVIHAKADDYKTDPSGNSGTRIACAVLGEPETGATVTPQTGSTVPAPPAATNAVEANMITENEAVPGEPVPKVKAH
jgi:Cu-Zn family superoxide dismutase